MFIFFSGNFHQSLSGSETDVSTSNENLSNEEKYVIRHTARQEPQGQENLQSSNRSSLRDSLPSNRSSLDVSSSSYNTLIIHSAGDEPWIGNFLCEIFFCESVFFYFLRATFWRQRKF